MRRLALALLALALLAGLFWITRDLEARIEQTASVPHAARPELVAELVLNQPAQPEAMEEPEEEPDAQRAPMDGAPIAVAELCQVIGRVLDGQGLPLADARLRLSSRSEWAEGAGVPRLAGGAEGYGYEVRSDTEGRFQFEAAVPTAEWVGLHVGLDDFHSELQIFFGAGQRSQLSAGLRDLGDLRLTGAGLIWGHVFDASGAPLAGIRLALRSKSRGHLGGGTSLADGHFRIPNAPPGDYALEASLEGFLSMRAELPTIQAGTEAGGISIVLQVAPTISGIVVDENGLAIAGATIVGTPIEGGTYRSTRASSGSDGRFVLSLARDEQYDLLATCDGYERWGRSFERLHVHAPGTTDLRVVMPALSAHEFLVLDAESGEPIEDYGLEILADNGSKADLLISTLSSAWPKIHFHPGGRSQASAQVGIDEYLIYAKGYLPAQADVERTEDDSEPQTVRLELGASVCGRVVDEDQPLPNLRVKLEYGSNGTGRNFRSTDLLTLTTATDSEGFFGFDGLSKGAFRVTITQSARAPTIRLPKRLAYQEERDLGDITLDQGGQITGQLQMPPGIDPSGMQIYLDDWRGEAIAMVDSSGAFQSTNLAPGPHALLLGGRVGVLAWSDPLEFILKAGETKHLTLDATRLAVCKIEVKIEIPGLSVEGMQVKLSALERNNTRIELEPCDKQGWARGFARGWGDVKLTTWGNGLGRLRHPQARLHLTPGGHLRETIRFDLAALTLRLPPEARLPENGTITIDLVSNTLGQPASQSHNGKVRFRRLQAETAQSAILRFQSGALQTSAPAFQQATPGRLHLASLFPGSWDYTLTFSTNAQPYTGSVVLEAGETVTAQVE